MARVCTLKTATLALVVATQISCGDGNEVTAAGSGTPGSSPSSGTGGAGFDFGKEQGKVTPGTGGGGTPSTNPGPTQDANCGVTDFNPQREPAELLLVLDKSGSMQESATMPMKGRNVLAPNRKWDAITTALGGVIEKTQADVYWGLKLFPAQNGLRGADCNGALPPEQAPALNAHQAIMGTIGTIQAPTGGTPTASAIQTAATYLKGRTTPNPKFIVLATDGLPTCFAGNGGADDGLNAIMSVQRAAQSGVPVFVIGISIDGQDQTLTQMAEAGGRPRNDAKKYYPTSSGDEFTKALESITGQIASCNYGLGQPIPSDIPIAVELGGTRLVEGTGWSFGAGRQSVELLGDACEKVKSGAVTNVKVLKGCPGKVIP